jgi:hypothetical protein
MREGKKLGRELIFSIDEEKEASCGENCSVLTRGKKSGESNSLFVG